MEYLRGGKRVNEAFEIGAEGGRRGMGALERGREGMEHWRGKERVNGELERVNGAWSSPLMSTVMSQHTW